MLGDPLSRQRCLVEVGEEGQSRLAALDAIVPETDCSDIEREYLLRAGVRSVTVASSPPVSFPHAAHFRSLAARRIATGAWGALRRIRLALGVEGP